MEQKFDQYKIGQISIVIMKNVCKCSSWCMCDWIENDLRNRKLQDLFFKPDDGLIVLISKKHWNFAFVDMGMDMTWNPY